MKVMIFLLSSRMLVDLQFTPVKEALAKSKSLVIRESNRVAKLLLSAGVKAFKVLESVKT